MQSAFLELAFIVPWSTLRTFVRTILLYLKKQYCKFLQSLFFKLKPFSFLPNYFPNHPFCCPWNLVGFCSRLLLRTGHSNIIESDQWRIKGKYYLPQLPEIIFILHLYLITPDPEWSFLCFWVPHHDADLCSVCKKTLLFKEFLHKCHCLIRYPLFYIWTCCMAPVSYGEFYIHAKFHSVVFSPCLQLVKSILSCISAFSILSNKFNFVSFTNFINISSTSPFRSFLNYQRLQSSELKFLPLPSILYYALMRTH